MSDLLGVLGKQLLLQNKAAASVRSSYQDIAGSRMLLEVAGGQQTFWEQFFTINGNHIEMAFGQFNPLKIILFFYRFGRGVQGKCKAIRGRVVHETYLSH